MDRSFPAPIGAATRLKRRRPRFTDITVSVVLPWLVFFLVLSLFLFAYHDLKIAVWVLISACMGLAALFVILGALARNATFLGIGFLCLTSVIAGAAVGLWLDGMYLQRYWELEGGMEYKDVSPTQRASKTKGASVINFAAGTFVDDRRTVGFVADRGIFCVAPIVSTTLAVPAQKVEYWAVGEDCCEQRSNFDCGTARELDARTVITERPSSFYSMAISQAASVYGANSTAEAQLVSFVSDPKSVISDMWDETLTIALAAMIVDLCMCAMAGIVVAKLLIPPVEDTLLPGSR